jgi:hypothetical protein
MPLRIKTVATKPWIDRLRPVGALWVIHPQNNSRFIHRLVHSLMHRLVHKREGLYQAVRILTRFE